MITSPVSALEHIRAMCVTQAALGAAFEPATFRHDVATAADQGLASATPAQQVAEALHVAAIQYELLLGEVFRERYGADADPEDYAGEPTPDYLVKLRALLEPLRPPEPINPVIERLILRAREEQMIDEGEAKDLRDLARRMDK